MRWVLLALLVAGSCCSAVTARCDRSPEGHVAARSPADGTFRIRISGNPDRYVPGEVYTVSLQGSRSLQIPHKFTGFLLAAEPEFGDYVKESLALHQGTHVGSFQLFGDALTKFSERCPNAVTQTSSLPKTEVQVLWTAPPPGSGCVVFRATVVEHRDVWYMDDGPLSKTLCEDIQESLDLQPAVVNPCCACDEAKYEVTFEGLWSRHTHPKDFPSNGWLTRFSDVIGASHTVDYRFWDYGQSASEGLRQVAEHGATRMLESELKAESEHIRTIIKARGISYPNVTGKTFAVFRVDSKHHLVSLVSMIDPSPDWIVGVSGLELCLVNCSWIESKVLNLYPWDAGTDSGPSYISPDQPTTPRDVIRRIKSNYPNDPRSPFYDAAGAEMKPLARLYLSRQRLYEKSCDPNNALSSEDDGEDSGPCKVGPWQWSQCSVSCGKGVRHRQRHYQDQMQAEMQSCNRKLTGRKACWGAVKHCREPYQNPEFDSEETDPYCELTEWSEWSGCSAQCGRGTRTRSRRYRRREAMKRCHAGRPRPPIMEQNDECFGEDENCENDQSDVPPKDCPMTSWSQWSPCSATCGRGLKMRTRIPIDTGENQRTMVRSLYKSRHEEEEVDEEDGDEPESAEEEDYGEQTPEEDQTAGPCAGVRREQEVVCEGESTNCDPADDEARAICSLPMEVGPCRASVERWFFDSVKETCEMFSYSTCSGNANNFETRQECEDACYKFKDDLLHKRANRRHKYGVSQMGMSMMNFNIPLQDQQMPVSGPFGGLSTGSQRMDRQLIGPLSAVKVTGDGSLSGYDGSPRTGPIGSQDQSWTDDLGAAAARDTMDITEEAVGAIVDCEVSKWTDWSECTGSCGRGQKQKSRHITVHPMNGGKQCPKRLFKRRRCKLPPCRTNEENTDSRENQEAMLPTWGPANTPDKTISVDCILSNWSPWSPCSKTCGEAAVKQRTRAIIQPPSAGGEPCGNRVQRLTCHILPCSLI